MRVGVAEMSGRSSSVLALLAMMVLMMAMLITQTQCFSINQTITVSYSAGCDGLNDDLSCLTGQTDLDSDEFMLDSDFSRRILAQNRPTDVSKMAGTAATCDRIRHPGCKPPGNPNGPPEHCTEPTNRACYRH